MYQELYWTQDRIGQLKEMIKNGENLGAIIKCFSGKKAMSIIFEARRISFLGNVPCRNKEAMKQRFDDRLPKHDVYVEANRRWEVGDEILLKRLFMEHINIFDICSKLGRTEPALFKRMEKLYPTGKDKEELFQKIAFYVKMKPVPKKDV